MTDPPLREHVTAEWVADKLAECLRGRTGYSSPDEDAVRHVVRRVNKYIDTPWDEAGVAQLRANVITERDEGATLNAAAEILGRDLTGWRQRLPRFLPGTTSRLAAERTIAELENAIARLKMVRGPFAGPGFTARISGRRPPTPWALTAAGIADEVIRTLRDGGDSRAGVGGPDGPVTKFTIMCLQIISPREKAWNPATVNDALKNHLDISLRYQRGVHSRGESTPQDKTG